MSAVDSDVALTVKVIRDSGPLGKAFGKTESFTVADVSGDMTLKIAASTLRGIADALDPPPTLEETLRRVLR